MELSSATARGFIPAASRDARIVVAVGLGALAACATVSIFAAVELRSLFADGSHYLLSILALDDFVVPTPSRRTIEILRQLPLIGAARLGIGDLQALGTIFGLTMELLPLTLTVLAGFILPHAHRAYFIFPLMHYLAGTLSSGFAPIAEAPTAAAWFWLLLFWILFRVASARSLALVVAASVPALLLHETMIFLAPVLAVAAAWRAKQERAAARTILAGLAAWFVVITALQLHYVLNASFPQNRGDYLSGITKGQWLVGYEGSINLPCALGLLSLALLGVQALRARRHEARDPVGWAMVVALALAAAVLYAFFTAGGRSSGASAQFIARNQAAFVSLPLAIAALAFASRGRAVPSVLLRQAAAAAAILAIAGAAWHLRAIGIWADYVAVHRELLAGARGFVSWEEAMAMLPPQRQRLMERKVHNWAGPTMSIILAPRGEVTTIIGANTNRWQPFDPRQAESVPRGGQWNIEPYLRALDEQFAERGRR